MTDAVAAAADGLVQNRGDLAGTEQMADYGSQLNEAGYAVIAASVDGAELGEIARFAGRLVCNRAGTRRLIELPWCRELATVFAQAYSPRGRPRGRNGDSAA